MKNHKITRRKFFGTSAVALAATAVVPAGLTSCTEGTASAAAPVEVGSKFNGVQIGAITYSWRSLPGGLENIIKYCKTAGITSLELMSGDLEAYLGAPASPPRAPRGQQPTPEQTAALEKYQQDVKNFRLNVSMDKVAQAKKLFDDAGIGIHIVKFSPANWPDEEIDYAFKVAKAMGAKAVCNETGLEVAQRLGPFAQKHDMYITLHNHAQFADPAFDNDAILAANPHVMMNFDAGHYFGTTGKNPCDFIRQHHDRIYSIHIKDKTGPTTEPANANQVFGQGQTPVAELLLMLQQEKWPIYVDIELEYQIAPWSTAEKEVATCVKFLRQILI